MRLFKYYMVALSILIIAIQSKAQNIPNLGEKVCPMWIHHLDNSSDPWQKNWLQTLDFWAMGFIKGMAQQYTYDSKDQNPLIFLREKEPIEWMRAYCRINKDKSISDAALAMLEELQLRALRSTNKQ